jgi:outer membrane protein TolC
MYKKTLHLLILILFIPGLTNAQNMRSFSLEQAISYALEHQPELIKSNLEIEIAERKVQETAAIGLPQVSGSFDFRQNIELPVFIFPNPATGEQTAFRVGQNYTNALNLQASQLIFDGQYFLGLKAASKYVDVSKKMKDLTERDIRLNVINAYHMALITEENVRLIDVNIKTLQESVRQTQLLYEQGFAEKIDAERVKLALFNLQTQKKNLEEQQHAAIRLMKFHMGMEDQQALLLTDSISGLFEKAKSGLDEQNASHEQRAEYQLLTAQQELNKLDRKRYIVNRYPSLSAFYNYQQNNFSDELTFDPWFQTQLWGLNLRIPIFSGGSNQAVLRQKEIEIKKTQQDMRSFLMLSQMQFENTKANIALNLSDIELQKSNLSLAQSVLESANLRFAKGTGSILDMLNAQQELRTARTNYLGALYGFLNAYTELQKIQGKL